jgi:DNA phosphorothioation-associated putative methyltransferase
VLLRRHSRTLLDGQLPRPPTRERTITTRPQLRERLAPFLEAMRATALPLGRLPEPDEVSPDLHLTLATARVAWPRALDLLRADLADDENFVTAGEIRRGDLLVHLALAQFPGSPTYRSLPRAIQRDIKAFFKSHADAQQQGRRLLFATGDRAGVKADVDVAVSSHFGGMRSERWFRFRSSALPRLPLRLRVLVGCAEVLQGGVDACDFVDIDLEHARISMVTCDDVENAVSFVTETVTVDLARLKVSANRPDQNTAPIYFKSRFLELDDDLRTRQIAWEASLMETGLFVPGSPEPSWPAVKSVLKVLGPLSEP